MKYTRTAIGLLTAQYRSVLKKCWLINVGLFALGAAAIMPSEAQADAYNRYSSDMRSAQTEGASSSPGWIANSSYMADGWRLAGNLDSISSDSYWDSYTTGIFVHEKRAGSTSGNASTYDSTDPSATGDNDYFVMGNFVGDVYYSLDYLRYHAGFATESYVNTSISTSETNMQTWVNNQGFLKSVTPANDAKITISVRGTEDSFTLNQSTAKTLTFDNVATTAELDDEKTTRSTADTNLQTAINNEITNRETAVSNEATARDNADKNILDGTTKFTKLNINDKTVTGIDQSNPYYTTTDGSNDVLATTATVGKSIANLLGANNTWGGTTNTFTNNVVVKGNTTLGDNSAQDTLTVNATSTFNNNVGVTGTVTASSNITSSGGNITATTGNISATAGSISAGSNLSAGGNLSVTGTAEIGSTTTVKGDLYVNNGANTMMSVDHTTGNISTDGSLNVKGNTTLGDTPSSDSVTINGKSYLKNDLEVQTTTGTKKMSVTSSSGDIWTAGSITADTNATINGDTTLGNAASDKLLVNADSTFKNNITVKNGEANRITMAYDTGNIWTYGNLQVDGNTILGNAQESDTLTVNAKTYINGDDIALGNASSDLLTVNANTIFKDYIRSDNGKTFTMYTGTGTTPQIKLDGSNGDIVVYNAGGNAPVAVMNRPNDKNGQITLSRYNSGTNTTTMINAQSTADGSVLYMNNNFGKSGITLENKGDTTPQGSLSMYAGGSTTTDPTLMAELKSTTSGGTFKLTDGTNLKNEQDKSSITLTNSSNNPSINILTEADGTGTIIVKNTAGTPVNTLNKDGITIADGKLLYMGTTDYNLDSDASKRNTIQFNGRVMDTFSLEDNLYDNNSHYGDANTIASTKTVANALGTLSGTNYLFDTEFGRFSNTVAENLKRIDSKIDTWTDRFRNITTSKAVVDGSDSAGGLNPTPTIGDTFEAIDQAIGRVANGNYVGPYNGNTSTNIAANINKLDVQLATTYSGMLTNREDLATLRSEVGYRNRIDTANKNLTYGSASSPATIVDALNNMSYTVGLIHNLANSDGTVNSTDTDSTVGTRTNLNYLSKTVSGQLVALDNAIDKAKTRIGNTETAIGTVTNLSTGYYVYGAGDLTTAVLTLDGQIRTNANRIGNLNSLTGSAAGKSNLVAAVNAVDSALTKEVNRAKGVETTLNTAIEDEVSRATTEEGKLRTAINNEVTRAKKVEGNLNNLQVTIPDGLDVNLVNAINSLKGTVDDLDVQIQNTGTDIGSLTDLKHNAISDKTKVTKAINSLAVNVANGMGGSFNTSGTWSGTASTYLGNKTVYNLLGAVQHVSDAIGTVEDFGATPANGLSVSNTVNKNLTALSSSLTNEIRRATREETTLHNDIAAETTRATEAEEQLDAKIDSEVTRARGVEGVLANLHGHATGSSNLVAAINAVDQATYDENTRALDAEATLRTSITAETARARTAEETNAANIANEVTRATQVENTLTTNLNTLTSTVGNLGNITSNAVSSRSSVTNAINSLANNVSTGMGGSFNGDGVWSGSVQTYKDTNPVTVYRITDAIDHISNTIGSVADLGYTGTSTPKNGLSKSNTVNANLAALNKAMGDVSIFKSNTYNNQAKNATDVVDAITKIDNYVSTIGGGIGDLGALTHPAITVSQRSKITSAVNSLATNVANGMGGTFTEGPGTWSDSIQTYKNTSPVQVSSIMDAVKYVAGANVIGTAAELGAEVNGISKNNTINANIGAVNSKLGNVGIFIADNYTGAAKNAGTAADAIRAIDQALTNEAERAADAEADLQTEINTVDGRVTTVNTNVTNLTNKVNNIGAGMGGSLTTDGVWSGTIKTYKDATDVPVSSLLEAIRYVAGANVIGTAAELGSEANGVSASNTINKNIGNLSSALTGEISRATTRETQINTALEQEVTRATEKETELTGSINTVKNNVTTLTNNVNTISTRVNKISTGMGGSFDANGDWSGTVQTYKDSAAVPVSTVMGAVDHVIGVIGTATELGTANGVSADNTINANIGALSSALTNEIDRATGKETELKNSITTVSGRVTTLSTTVENMSTKVNNIGTSLGGDLTSDGVWSGSMKTYRDSGMVEYDNIFDTVKKLNTNIGTAAELGTANGVSASNTVNKNIGALSSALTTAVNESVTRDETLQTNITNVDNSVTTLGNTVNNLSTTVDALDTSVTNMGNTVNTLNTNVTNLGNWVGAGPFTHNAISDKSNITGAVDSLAANVERGMGGSFDATGTWKATILDNSSISYGQINGATAITGVLSQVVSNIGTRADLGYGVDPVTSEPTTPKNGLSDSNSVNANLAALNSAVGNVGRFSEESYRDTVVKGSTSVVAAIESLDSYVKDIVVAGISGDIDQFVTELHQEINRSTNVDNNMQIQINGLGARIGEWPSPRNNAITDVTSVTNAIESLADNIETATGGTFQEGGSWKGSVTAYKVAQESDAAAPKDFTTIMGAINYVSDVIGDAEDLGYGTDPQTLEPITPANNVSKTKTVNENIAALNAALVSVQDGYATKAEVHGVDGTTGDIVNLGELADKTNIGTATTGIKIDTTDAGKKVEVVADTIKLGDKITVNNTNGMTTFSNGGESVKIQNGTIETSSTVKTAGLILTDNTSTPVSKVDSGAAPVTSGAADIMATTATVYATVGNAAALDSGNFAGSGDTVADKLAALNTKVGNVSNINVELDQGVTKNVVNAINKINSLTTAAGTDITHIKAALGNTFDATTGVWGDTLQTYKDTNPVEFTDVMSAIKHVAGANVIGTAAELGSANGVSASKTINANIGALSGALTTVKQDLTDKYALKTEVHGDNNTSTVDTVSIGNQADKTEIGTATTGIKLDDTTSGKKIELTANTIKLGDQITITESDDTTAISGNVTVGGKTTLSSDATTGGLSFGNETTVATSIVNTIGEGSANALATSQAVKNYVGTGDLTLKLNGSTAGTFNANASTGTEIDLGYLVTQAAATPAAEIKTNGNTTIIEASADVGSNLTKMANVVKNNADTIANAVTTVEQINLVTDNVYVNDGNLITSGAVRNYVEGIDDTVVHKAGPEDITGTKTFKAAQNFEKTSGANTYTTIIDGKTLTMKNGSNTKITLDAQSGNANIGGTLDVAGLATLSGGAAIANGQSLTVGNGAGGSTPATFNLNGTQAVSQIVNEVTSTDEDELKSQLVTAKAVKNVVDSIAVADGDKVIVSNNQKKMVSSNISTTELNQLSGINTDKTIQAQLNDKMDTADWTTTISDVKYIRGDKIAAKSIDSTQLNDDAVTTDKILNENVTKAKLEHDVQTSLDKADTALQNVKINGTALTKTDNAVNIAVVMDADDIEVPATPSGYANDGKLISSGAVREYVTGAVSNKVSKTGDTMTGALTINNGAATDVSLTTSGYIAATGGVKFDSEERIMKGTYTGDLNLGTEGDGGNDYTLVTTKALASTLYNEAQNGKYRFGTADNQYINSDTDTTIGAAITRLNQGLYTVNNSALTSVMVNGEALQPTNNAVDIVITESEASGKISVNGHDVAITNVVTKNEAQDITATKTFKALQKFTKTEQQIVEEQPVTVTYETDIDGKTLTIGKVGDAAITLNGADGSSVFDGQMQVGGGITTTTLDTSGAINSGGLITASAGVNTTTLTASGLVTANKGITVKDGEKLIFNNAELTKVLTGTATLTDDDDTIASSRVIKNAITTATDDMAKKTWVLGDTGSQLANFTASGTSSSNILADGVSRKLGDAVNYLGQQTLKIKNKFGTDAELGYDPDDATVIPANNIRKENTVNANIAALNTTIGDLDDLEVTLDSGVEKNVVNAINKVNYDLQNASGYMTGYVTKPEVHGVEGETGHNVVLGEFADTTTIGTDTIGIKIDTTDAGKKVEVKGDTIKLGEKVAINNNGQATFGTGSNTVNIQNGAITATGNTTTGGLIIKNGADATAYTSQTITRIDADGTNPLTEGSATTLATTQTVARTVGNVASLNTGNFQGTGGTVADKLSKLDDVIGAFSALGSDSSKGISSRNKLTNAIASLADNVAGGMGGTFNAGTGAWSGQIQTYKDPSAVTINSLMEGINHVVDVIGTAADLGYTTNPDDPTTPIAPKNGLLKSNTVNANLAALNTVIGDRSIFNATSGYTGNAQNAADVVHAIAAVDNAVVQEVIRAQAVEGNLDNLDPDLNLTGADKNLVNAINKVNETVKAIDGDYVTQAEIHGGTGHENIVFGDAANTTTIGTATTGIKVDTTNAGKKVEVKADTIKLGDTVTVNNSTGLTTFGSGDDIVKIQNGAVEAAGNVKTAGLVLTNNTTPVSKVDAGTAPVTSGAADTMATTATVYATVGNVAGLTTGNFTGSGNTVEAKLSALDTAVGDVSGLTTGNFTGSGDHVVDKLTALDSAIGDKSALGSDASNGIKNKSDVTHAIASLAENVGGGMGGEFNATTGKWGGSVQTYKDTSPVAVTTIMGAVDHVVDVIGTATDLGYDNTDPSNPITPKNGVDKSKTVNANIAAVNAAVGDVSTLAGTWAPSETKNVVNAINKINNSVNTANENIDDVKDSFGGNGFDSEGNWSASASTYRSTITVNKMMDAVNHISNTIGSVADLGYDNSDPLNPVEPKNGLLKTNTVNQNLAALNAAIGDTSALAGTWETSETKNVVNAINKVNGLVNTANTQISNIKDSFGGDFDATTGEWKATISTYYKTDNNIHTVVDAVKVVSDTIGKASQLTTGTQTTLSASNTVNENLRALNNALDAAKQSFSTDYVTKPEIHGDNDPSTTDTVTIGDQAAKTVIGTANTGVIVDTTDSGSGTRVDITGDRVNIGTTVEVNDQTGNVTFRGNTGSVEINNGNVSATGVTIGGNTVDSIDTGTAITSANASSSTLATTATVAATVSSVMGGEIDPTTGKWSARVSTYLSTIEAESFLQAVNHVSNTIGTAADLGTAMNGVDRTNTVNTNIAAVNSTIGDLKGLAKDLKNLTNGKDGEYYNPQSVVEVLNNIDSTMGRIHGLANTDGTVNSTRIVSTVGNNTNLARGTTIEDHLVSLDNAIGNRNYTSTNIVGQNSSTAAAISALDKSIGSAADLGKNPINGVKAGNSVNANIAAVNTALGDISQLKNSYLLSDAVSMTDAVQRLDAQIYGMSSAVNEVAHQLNDVRKEMRGGLASAAALSALVPNARSDGKTSLSLGLGGYKGTQGVAVGGFHYFTDHLLFNVGASLGVDSEAMYRVGMTYTF